MHGFSRGGGTAAELAKGWLVLKCELRRRWRAGRMSVCLPQETEEEKRGTTAVILSRFYFLNWPPLLIRAAPSRGAHSNSRRGSRHGG